MKPKGPRRWAAGRGMTLIEVVLASLLLAMLASALMGAVIYANRSDMLRIKRLMAYDVANRIMLQYVDEHRSKHMPPASQPVLHEGHQFRFELLEESTTMEMLVGETPGLAQDLKLIRVRVYDTVEPVPGDVQRGDLLAELVRPHHLLVSLFRGEDSKNRNMKNMDYIQDIQRIQMGGSGGQGGSGGSK